MRYLKFIIPLLFIVNAWAITGQGSSRSAGTNAHTEKALHMGEHVPVEYSGSGDISHTNSEVYYTQWMQIGWGNDANIYHNNEITVYNPEIFTLFVTLTTDGDSASLTDAKFQIASSASDTLITATLTCDEADTSTVGDIFTGSESGASMIITAITTGTAAGDSIVTGYMYPGNIFDTSSPDTVGSNGTMEISAASYTGGAENADSSNLFIESGNYSHDLYNICLYEVQSRTDITLVFRLNVLAGAYVRLYFADDTVADVTTVTWTLKGEN